MENFLDTIFTCRLTYIVLFIAGLFLVQGYEWFDFALGIPAMILGGYFSIFTPRRN